MLAQKTDRPPARHRGRVAAAVPGLRRCIASGQSRPKQDLIRFVAAPDGIVSPDLAERLPGRGLWVTADREVMAKACKRNAFAKAAKAPLQVPNDLIGRVDRLLSRRCLDLLGLAKRSGDAVSGFEQVTSWLASGRVRVLLAALDAAEDSRRKLHTLTETQDPGVAVVELFTAEELGRALGFNARVYVTIAPGGCAERLVCDAARLARLRGHVPPKLDG